MCGVSFGFECMSFVKLLSVCLASSKKKYRFFDANHFIHESIGKVIFHISSHMIVK